MRTVHGVLVEEMWPHELEHWLQRYAESFVDAKRRGDSQAARMYELELAKLLARPNSLDASYKRGTFPLTGSDPA